MRKNSTKQNTQRELTPPERHRWVDQWLVAKGQPLRTLVDEIAALIAHHEEQQVLRKRARRTVDAANHHTSINVIVSNLAYTVLMPPPTGRLAISTRNAKGMTRYDNRALGPKPLRALLGTLDDLGLIEYGWSKKRGEASSLWPSSRFTENVHRLGVTLAQSVQRAGYPDASGWLAVDRYANRSCNGSAFGIRVRTHEAILPARSVFLEAL